MKTLRMIFPQWQGGINVNYAFGSKILNFIAPADSNSKTIEVPVPKIETSSDKDEPFYEREALVKQQIKAKEILRSEKPDKVIVFGGDCSVSQAPFDYLHEKYPENTGILWIDAHPDISKPENGPNEHAMVLGNLLGEGAREMAELVDKTFAPKDILYLGLRMKDMHDYEKEYLKKKDLEFLTDKDIREDSKKILDWIKSNDLKQILIHFDVDVLDPKDFRSQLTNKPDFGPITFALGTLTLDRVFEILREVQNEAQIVGLTIAEFLPWDLIRLSEAMKDLKIFTD